MIPPMLSEAIGRPSPLLSQSISSKRLIRMLFMLEPLTLAWLLVPRLWGVPVSLRAAMTSFCKPATGRFMQTKAHFRSSACLCLSSKLQELCCSITA